MKQSKKDINDYCADVAQDKRLVIDNGFIAYNNKLIDRVELRKMFADKHNQWDVSKLDKLEQAAFEHRVGKLPNPRQMFLASLPDTKEPCRVLEWLQESYPHYNWLQIFADIINQQSERIYLLNGKAGTGKSQILDLLETMFGKWSTNLTLNQISNKFNISEISGKLLIKGDDLGNEGLGDVGGLVKSMSTGHAITVERKFQAPYTMVNRANFIFATNRLPHLDLTDAGILRRFVVLNIDKPILNKDKDFASKNNTLSQAAALYNAVKSVDINEEYLTRLVKLSSKQLIEATPLGQARDYPAYRTLCTDNGYKPLNKGNYEVAYELYMDVLKVTMTNSTLHLNIKSKAEQELDEAGI